MTQQIVCHEAGMPATHRQGKADRLAAPWADLTAADTRVVDWAAGCGEAP